VKSGEAFGMVICNFDQTLAIAGNRRHPNSSSARDDADAPKSRHRASPRTACCRPNFLGPTIKSFANKIRKTPLPGLPFALRLPSFSKATSGFVSHRETLRDEEEVPVIAASRTLPSLLSGWGCRGRHLSRGSGTADRPAALSPCRRQGRRTYPVPSELTRRAES